MSLNEEEEEEDMICDLPSDRQIAHPGASQKPNLLKQALKRGLPPHPVSSTSKGLPKRDFAPIEWSEFFDEKREINIGEDIFNVYLKGKTGPIFYFLHGGGYSGLTWACLTKELTHLVDCRILAPDLRGHGDSKCADEHDLSTATQVRDIANIYKAFFGENDHQDVCVVGHSMGGALAIHAVSGKAIPANIVGLVVIDVVEGSAMEALGGMVHFLHSRPSSFESVEKAIKWCLSSGTVRNAKSARVSMPSQIRAVSENEYAWRIELADTEPYWKGWFEGLSAKFLMCTAPKLLALAGVDRLDRELTIGQMQGKFQTCVLPKVGHCVHEDSPDRLADELARFATRYRFARATPAFLTASPTHRPPIPGGFVL
ncbi:unnamed protein product [Caenorhabditis bovis]|uniref:Protein phosphatase methylesterase 1 n=1 Tax=Caenorhabditis bovis TaxID=2654633 RepID=A0A8S1EQ68_9PELO|nr:unnamed protein product [Caenorhabditis bovis]